LTLQNQFADFEVVGIAKDVRYETLTQLDDLHVYVPTGGPRDYTGGLLFRVQGDRAKALAAVQAAVESVDRNLLQGLILVSMEEGPVAMQKNTVRIMAVFSGVLTLLSLTLTAVGIYGVMAFLVSQQTREIGIRMALGGTAGAVMRRIVMRGLRPVLLGMAVGFPVAAGIDVASSMDTLRESMFLDPAAYGLLAMVLAIAVFASVIPARRAMRVDPVSALRHE